MGKDLWEADDAVKALYQEANEALGYDLQRLCFVGPEDELRLTQNAQPAILVHSIATWTCISRHGLRPVLLAGHSLGEYSALAASGVLHFADAIHLVQQRGVFMQEAVPPGVGSMAALLGVAHREVEALCAEFGESGVLQPATIMAPAKLSLLVKQHAYRLPSTLSKHAVWGSPSCSR
jgi:[acyl-carrier-protein] S-malonyltransferase